MYKPILKYCKALLPNVINMSRPCRTLDWFHLDILKVHQTSVDSCSNHTCTLGQTVIIREIENDTETVLSSRFSLSVSDDKLVAPWNQNTWSALKPARTRRISLVHSSIESSYFTRMIAIETTCLCLIYVYHTEYKEPGLKLKCHFNVNYDGIH